MTAKADAWKTGDSVLVVGSKRHSVGDSNDNEKLITIFGSILQER